MHAAPEEKLKRLVENVVDIKIPQEARSENINRLEWIGQNCMLLTTLLM